MIEAGTATPTPAGAAGPPLRILLTTWQHFGAGSIQSVQYLAEGLLERGHDVLVACPADGVLGRRLERRGVPLVDFDFPKGWSLRAGRALARLVREGGFQVVDAQESRDRKAAIVARLLFRMDAALIITRRQQSASFPPLNAFYARVADRVIAISEGVRRDLAGRGMPADRIRVVHTGLHPDRLAGDVAAADRERLRDELGLDPALPTVGVVARRKDQETLLRAAARLGRPLNLLFVGIDRDPALAALEPALPAGTRTVYAGFRDPVLPLLALLDVKVLTTVREGLSQAILEAMALRVPVITAAAGGTPEVVQHGVNGLLFPPGDDAALAAALGRLLAEPELRARLVDQAAATVWTRFGYDVMAKNTERVYRDVLGPAAGVP